MSTAQRNRAATLLQRLDDDATGTDPLRPMHAIEAVDLLRQAGAPDSLLRDVHPNVHSPAQLRPVVAELLRWLQGGAR
tara:strand:- start:561 stop:794 length:234 start_codon:yes stop_codon:yes gene_type:complete